MDFRIAAIFTNSLNKLTGDEQKRLKRLNAIAIRQMQVPTSAPTIKQLK
jgi:hypothetical protein